MPDGLELVIWMSEIEGWGMWCCWWTTLCGLSLLTIPSIWFWCWGTLPMFCCIKVHKVSKDWVPFLETRVNCIQLFCRGGRKICFTYMKLGVNIDIWRLVIEYHLLIWIWVLASLTNWLLLLLISKVLAMSLHDWWVGIDRHWHVARGSGCSCWLLLELVFKVSIVGLHLELRLHVGLWHIALSSMLLLLV